MLPLVISGLTAFGSNKFIFANMKYRGLYSVAVFGGTFMLTKNIFEDGKSDAGQH